MDTLYIRIKAQIYEFGGLVWASEAWATYSCTFHKHKILLFC